MSFEHAFDTFSVSFINRKLKNLLNIIKKYLLGEDFNKSWFVFAVFDGA